MNLSTPSHWQKSFATFGLGSSSQILVPNWKKYPCQFHWQRGFLACAKWSRFGTVSETRGLALCWYLALVDHSFWSKNLFSFNGNRTLLTPKKLVCYEEVPPRPLGLSATHGLCSSYLLLSRSMVLFQAALLFISQCVYICQCVCSCDRPIWVDHTDLLRKCLDNVLTKLQKIGQWLWLGWQSGRFEYQRSSVWIQSFAKFYNEHINCWLLKRSRERPIKQNSKTDCLAHSISDRFTWRQPV